MILAKFNMRRGVFRFWIIFAVLWLIISGINSYPHARDELQYASLESQNRKELKPWELYQLDYLKRNRGCPSIFDSRGVKELSDEELYKAASGVVNFDCVPFEKSKIITDFLKNIFCVPLITLILGLSIFWAIDGFRKDSSA